MSAAYNNTLIISRTSFLFFPALKMHCWHCWKLTSTAKKYYACLNGAKTKSEKIPVHKLGHQRLNMERAFSPSVRAHRSKRLTTLTTALLYCITTVTTLRPLPSLRKTMLLKAVVVVQMAEWLLGSFNPNISINVSVNCII